MNFLIQLGLMLISAIIMYLLQPKIEGPKPATMEDFNVPKTQEGAEIGRAYGTNWFKDAQVVWYGDFTSEGIKASGGKK
jgi:hypothetical protein